MRKYFFLCLLVVAHSLHAQSWLWGRQAFPMSNARSVPGFSQSSGSGIATDYKGNIFETGWFRDTMHLGSYTLFTPQDSSISYNSPGCFLVKYNTNGNVLWANSGMLPYGIYGPNNEKYCIAYAYGQSVSTDKEGNAYMAGYYHDTVTFGSYTLSSANTNTNINTLLVKYDSNGNVLWAKGSLPYNNISPSYAYAYSVSADRFGNSYLTGWYSGFAIFGPDTLSSSSILGDAFLVKYDSKGNVLWARTSSSISPSSLATAYGVSADNLGNAYITGYIYQKVAFGKDSLTCISASSVTPEDAFLTKYDSNGNEVWAKNISLASNASFSQGESVSTDSLGYVYETGLFGDTINTGSNVLSSNAYYGDFYLVKYDPKGNMMWSRTDKLGSGADYAKGYSVSTDRFGYEYVVGQFLDTISFGPYTFNESYPLAAFGDALFLVKYDSSGSLQCATTLPSGGSYVCGVSADDFNNVFITSRMQRGSWSGPNMTVGPYVLQDYYTGQLAYIAKYVCCTPFLDSIRGAEPICKGSMITLSSQGGTNYIWSTGATTSSISVNPANTTTYSVTIYKGFCKDTASVQVVVDSAIAAACCNSVMTLGQTVSLYVTPASKYHWYPSSTLSCDSCQSPIASPAITTCYYILTTNGSGCTTLDSVLITVKENCSNIFVPDAFSPNQDGQNDILYVRGPCITTMDFIIYDRWGEKVFESESVSDGWDGTYKGQAMNTGTYVYYLKATMQDGSVVDKKGNITLVR